jgi:hypothetical protein
MARAGEVRHSSAGSGVVLLGGARPGEAWFGEV